MGVLTCLTDEIEQSRGYVTFSLTNGPEYHVSQVFFVSILVIKVSIKIALLLLFTDKELMFRSYESSFSISSFKFFSFVHFTRK